MFIAIEWTSAAFHAWRLQADGAVIAEHSSTTGVNAVKDGAFEAALRAEIGPWLADTKAIVLSGMVTSRTGWVESPFAMVPAAISDQLDRTVRKQIAGLPPLYFLPGVARLHPVPDVMRGEEMAIFGIEGNMPEWVLLPGAHTKWVRTDGSRITDLTTYMSGEILNLLRKDSLVSRLIPALHTPNELAFDRGVDIARDKLSMPGGVLQRIFSARSLVLFDRLPPADIVDYLTGILIGSEIAEALAGTTQPEAVVVLGQSATATYYRRALSLFGIASPLRTSQPSHAFSRLIAALGNDQP